MENYLWHAVSDKEKGEIEKQAKNILDSFARELEKIPQLKESFVERKEFERNETAKEEKTDDDFRKIMLENAPDKNSDCIIAEKGDWT